MNSVTSRGLENFLILALSRKCLKQTPFCEIEKRMSPLFGTISCLIKVLEASENKKQNFCPKFGKESYLIASGKITCILFNLILNRTETHETEHARCNSDWRATFSTKQWKNGRIRSVCHVFLVVYFQDWRLVISTHNKMISFYMLTAWIGFLFCKQVTK